LTVVEGLPVVYGDAIAHVIKDEEALAYSIGSSSARLNRRQL